METSMTYTNVALKNAETALHSRHDHCVEVEVLVCPRIDKPLLVVTKPYGLNVP